jgi:hypothetical protein
MTCFAMEEYETAKAAFEKGQQLDHENATFKTWIRKCMAEMEIEGNTNKPSNPPENVTHTTVPSKQTVTSISQPALPEMKKTRFVSS